MTLAALSALTILSLASPARAGRIGDDENPWGELPRQGQESNSLLEFFKERTHIGYGFDEEYFSNYFLEDNNKQNEFISTVEAELFFADPRGSVLYGAGWEINAFRHHRADANAVDHDVRGFFDYDAGGRLQYRLDYQLNTSNTLLYGVRGIDLIRRSRDFQRSVKHEWLSKLQYALNETNALVPRVSYSLLDDQTVNDASGDRREFRAILDIDHDLKPGWTVFTGYGFKDVQIRGNKIKNSDTHSIRLGTRYDLTDLVKLDLTLTGERRVFKDKSHANNFGMDGKWEYQAGPRTLLTLGYVDAHTASFAEGRRQFRSMRPTTKVSYDLTSLIKLKVELAYERQISAAGDDLSGSSTEIVSSYFDLGTGLEWSLRESTKVTLDYRFNRSKTADYTGHYLMVGFESELGGNS